MVRHSRYLFFLNHQNISSLSRLYNFYNPFVDTTLGDIALLSRIHVSENSDKNLGGLLAQGESGIHVSITLS